MTLYMEYSKPSTVSLEPCVSLESANMTVAAVCSAAALDATFGVDLCGSVAVTDVSSVPNQAKYEFPSQSFARLNQSDVLFVPFYNSINPSFVFASN